MKHTAKWMLPVLLILVFVPVSGWAESGFHKKLNEFISIALLNNPELLAAQNKIKAYREVPSQAASLDDPILRFELKNLPVDTFAFDEQAMTQKKITFSQKFPFPGKLGLKREIENKNVGIAEESYDELKLKIRRQVKQAFYELCFILAAIEITKQNKVLLQQFVIITETKYSLGKGLQQDVLKAQVEISKILDELIKLNKRKKSVQAQLNTLMNLLPQSPLTIPHGIAKSTFTYTIEELQALAEKHRPVLKEINLLKERYQVARTLAQKEYYPNFNVGISYGQRENGVRQNWPDLVSAFVGINIPLWHKTKQSRKVLEETYKVDMVREAYNDARNKIFLRLKQLVDEEARGAETLSLIRSGILPQARQSLESAVAGYNVDKVDFLTLLDNQVTLLKWEIKYHRELTDYEKTLAEAEHAVGKVLF